MTILFKMLFTFFVGCWNILCYVAEVTLFLYCMLTRFDTKKYKIAENIFISKITLIKPYHRYKEVETYAKITCRKQPFQQIVSY